MKTITLFAMAIAAFAAALAQASEPEAATSIVHTADLDLSSQVGQQQLDQRLAQAAREVCGTASPSNTTVWKSGADILRVTPSSHSNTGHPAPKQNSSRQKPLTQLPRVTENRPSSRRRIRLPSSACQVHRVSP